jgi:hypothetical protein
VYERYFGELKQLLQLPGAARRATLNAPIVLPPGYKPLPPPADMHGEGEGATPGIKPSDLPGIVRDDSEAQLTGPWAKSGAGGLKGYVGAGYIYRSPKETGGARYEFAVPAAGAYEVRVSYGAHENRATDAPVLVQSAEGERRATLNQRTEPRLPHGFVSVGTFRFEPGKPAAVTVGAGAANGMVHADAVQLVPVK